MNKSEFKIFSWGLLLFGSLGFLYFKREIDKLKTAQGSIEKTVAMGIRG